MRRTRDVLRSFSLETTQKLWSVLSFIRVSRCITLWVVDLGARARIYEIGQQLIPKRRLSRGDPWFASCIGAVGVRAFCTIFNIQNETGVVHPTGLSICERSKEFDPCVRLDAQEGQGIFHAIAKDHKWRLIMTNATRNVAQQEYSLLPLFHKRTMSRY